MENQIVKINNTELNSSNSILVINQNIKTLEDAVSTELSQDKYNSVVTMQNFKEMKASSQELGKIAKQISDFRIEKKKEEMKDIDLFDSQLKGFTQQFKDKQESIKSGLEVFENETKAKVVEVCKAYFVEYADEVELRQEFRNINLDDMTQTGYATATFKISAKGKAEVERRVNIQLTLQTKADNRLLNLENECLKANIEPLTQQHIQGFLYSNDEEYEIKLRNLIVAEIERNKAVAQREKEKAEQELRAKIEEEEREKLKVENEAKEEEYKGTQLITKEEAEAKQKANSTPFDEQQEPVKTEDGKIRKSVTVTFDVVVPVAWADKVQAVYEKRFKENVKDVENMKVEVR